MKTYTVKIELVVDAYEDFPRPQMEELIKNDIESELNCCWHNMDIVSIEVWE